MSAQAPDVKVIRWIDRHPRTGWYLGVLLALNYLLDLLQVFS